MRKTKRLKKIVFLVMSFVFIAIGCQKSDIEENDNNDCVNEKFLIDVNYLLPKEEYEDLSRGEREIALLINTGIVGLQNAGQSEKLKDYIVYMEVSSDLDDDSSNFMVLSKDDVRIDPARLKECRINGIGSGISCAKKIRADVDNCGSLNINIKKSGDGYRVCWEGC